MEFPSQAQRTMDADALRRAQAEEGRRLAQAEVTERKVISMPGANRPAGGTSAPMYRTTTKTATPTVNKTKGHEAFLNALKGNGADIVVEMISSARTYFGKLRHSDKFTLTVNVTGVRYEGEDTTKPITEAYDRVLFKHDISEFYTTTPPAFAPKVGARA